MLWYIVAILNTATHGLVPNGPVFCVTSEGSREAEAAYEVHKGA